MQRAWSPTCVKRAIRIALFLAEVCSSASAGAADPATAPIAVVLHSPDSALSIEALNRALTEELEVPAVPDSQGSTAARGLLTVTYRPLTKELVVSYSEASRGTITRVVPAPEQVTDVPALAALVAGNLVRDQAAEFLPVSAVAPASIATEAATPTATVRSSTSQAETRPLSVTSDSVNAFKWGGVHALAWSSNTTYANLGVKFATRYPYFMLSGAMHHDGNHALYGAGLTMGASIPISKQIWTELDLQALHLFANASCAPQQSATEGNAYYPKPPGPAVDGSCAEQPTVTNSSPYNTPKAALPTDDRSNSGNARQYDQSLVKLRALLRFELLSHLSLFVGTGVTGQITYPVVDGDSQVKFGLLSEFFGGVQL